jgi:hypothetical protein
MTRHLALLVGVVAYFVTGCASPVQRVLSRIPDWRLGAQHMAAEKNSYTGGLIWEPFPDLTNPLHLEIWKLLQKQGEVGDGFGAICNYYGTDLVTVSVSYSGISTTASYFYVPKYHALWRGSDGTAFNLYKGDLVATPTNAISLVKHLLAVDEYKAFVICRPDDIPHTVYLKDNPRLPFDEFLVSKSIIITPPTLMRVNGDEDHKGYGVYNVFVYMPCGGQIFRYEVRCSFPGNIEKVSHFLIGEEIGDLLYLY